MASNQSKEVVVVIPTLNGAMFLPELLDSLGYQDIRGFPVVVSDNGSTDETIDIVDRYIRSSSLNLSIIDSSDKNGKAYALNEAIRKTDSRKVLMIDQDDTVNSSYVSSMARALDETPFVAACMDAEVLNTGFMTQPRYAPRDQKIGQFAIKIAAGGTLGVDRSVFDDIGLFNESFNYSTNDVEFCVRAHYSGYDLRLVKDTILNYRFRRRIIDNYRQGVYYGEGNFAIAQIYPEVRGDQKGIPALAIDTAKLLIKFATEKKSRVRAVHNIGKNVGQIKARLGALSIQ